MKRFCSLILCLLAFTAAAQQQQAEALFARFKAAAGFDYNYPREKAYLHLDNNAYMEGETLWFKAYVVRASTLRPSGLSRVLYVDLLNASGQLMDRRLLRVDSLGQAHGEFNLELPVRSGYYEVRAYTREMVNWGREACFSRVVPVFRRPVRNPKKLRTDDIAAGRLDVTPPDSSLDLPGWARRPAAQPAERGYALEFYPEGGNRVAGLAQRVAFRLTDAQGRPLLDTLRLCRSDGTEMQRLASGHEGMGRFVLPADFDEGYAAVGYGRREARFDLPAPVAQEEFVMAANRVDGGVEVILAGRDAAHGGHTDGLLGLAVFCREEACYFDTLTLGAEPAALIIPDAALHGGVNRIELFDQEGRSLCRRLVWHDAPQRQLQLSVRQNQSTYDAFSPVALELELKDAAGQPVQARFSLAVRDDGGELAAGTDADAATDLLLASELKGYVHDPAYYFAEADARRRTDLDLLLMVQGWTANTFETMCGRDSFRLQEPIEENLTLNGSVFRDNGREEPCANLDLSLKMYTRDGGALDARTRTDAQGRFAFVSAVDFTGDWIAQFYTTDTDGRKQWSHIALDRWFEPDLRRLDPRETEVRPPFAPTAMAGAAAELPDTFAWRDTIPRFVASELHEAVVTHRNRYRGFTGNRYTWNGGEEAGMRQCDIFYDITRAVERCKDSGHDPGYIMDFLAYLDKSASVDRNFDPAADAPDRSIDAGVDYGPTRQERTAAEMELDQTERNESDRLLYHNRPATVYVNNETPKTDVGSLLAEEVKSVAVVRRGARSNHITGSAGTAADGGSWAIYIYEDPDYYRFRGQKGVERRHVEGYSRPRAFYSPSYRGLDEPAASDVRRTLFWEPNLQTDPAGRASAVFFTNARERVTLRISAHGVTPDGRFVDYER